MVKRLIIFLVTSTFFFSCEMFIPDFSKENPNVILFFVENLYNLKHSIQWQKGTRWSTGAIIEGISDTKEKIKIIVISIKYNFSSFNYIFYDLRFGFCNSSEIFEIFNMCV